MQGVDDSDRKSRDLAMINKSHLTVRLLPCTHPLTRFNPTIPMSSKRVVLRLREKDFPNISPPELITCVQALLVYKQLPPEEAFGNKHFWHFHPSNGKEDSRFHIVVDIDISGHSGSVPEVPHEIYRVIKSENDM